MEFVDAQKCCFEDNSRGSKQITILWGLMALLIISMDLLSFVGLLPFPGGYTFPVIAFLYFTLAPRMWSIIATMGSWLTPAVLFLLLNAMIIAILLSSGCLASLSKEDMSNLLPVAASQAVPEEEKLGISKSRALTRSSSAAGAASKAKVVKKVTKRQYSAPAALQRKKHDEFSAEEYEQQQKHQQPQRDHQEELCFNQEQWHSSSLIIMELPSAEAAAAVAGTKAPSFSQGMSLYSNHLMTCDQDVFNEIIGNYIDKFKQDMRQQENNGAPEHHQLIGSSYSSKW